MNETTADGTITLEHAECLAACDYAPVVTVNYEFFDNQTVDSAPALVEQLRGGRAADADAAARRCATFKEIERQIAGFFDRARKPSTGEATGVPTEAGVQLASEARRVRAVLRNRDAGHRRGQRPVRSARRSRPAPTMRR